MKVDRILVEVPLCVLNFIEFSLYHKGLKSPKCLLSENLVYLISVTK